MPRWNDARAGLCGQKLHKMNATLEKVKVFFLYDECYAWESKSSSHNLFICLYVVKLTLRLKNWKFIFHFQSDTKELRFGEGKQRSLWLLLILGDWGEGYFHFFMVMRGDIFQKSEMIFWRVSCPKKLICKHFLIIWSSLWGTLAC